MTLTGTIYPSTRPGVTDIRHSPLTVFRVNEPPRPPQTQTAFGFVISAMLAYISDY